MVDKEFTVLALLDLDLKGHNSLNLRCLHGRRGLVREITIPDMNRPGLALSGFFENFAYKRVQVFGRGEVAYLKKLIHTGNTDSIKQFFDYINRIFQRLGSCNQPILLAIRFPQQLLSKI